MGESSRIFSQMQMPLLKSNQSFKIAYKLKRHFNISTCLE